MSHESDTDSIHRALGRVPPVLQMNGHGAPRVRTKNKKVIIKLYTDHMKALTKTTDCTVSLPVLP